MNSLSEGSSDGMRVQAARALRWWIGELRAAGADLSRRAGPLAGSPLVVEAGEVEWRFRRGTKRLGSCPADSAAAAIRNLNIAAARGVMVEIPSERVLSKAVALPAEARGRLDRVLGFEISRHFPFAAERVFFAHHILGGAADAMPGPAPLSVELAVVPREIVFEIADRLAAAGLRPGAFALVPAPGAAPLLLPADPLLPVGRPGAAACGLRIAVAVLALAAAISWPVAQQVRLAAVDREIAALKPAAEAVLRARAERRREAEQQTAMLRLRAARPPLVGALDMLTRVVPDGSWLISLSIAGHDVVVDGLAPSAAAIALELQR